MSRSRSTETILTLVLGLIIIYFIGHQAQPLWLYFALGIGIPGLFWKWFRFKLHDFWFWIAEKIGAVMSSFVLTLLFFTIVIPFGYLSRLFRKDLMFMKKRNDSYYRVREHDFTAQDLENPW